MSYIKQNFASGQILKADQLNHIEEGIENIENKMPPENPDAHQQLVTDADGNITWEDKLAYTTKEEQEFIPEETIEKGWTGILTASVMGSTGDRVIVTYNDVVYQGTLNTDNSTIWRVIFDEGVNFPESDLLVCAPGMNANGFSWQVGGTIKATILADKYHTLPSEYLGIAVKPGDDDTSVKIAPDSTGDGEASYYSVSMQSGHATGAYSVALGDGNSEGAFSFAQGSGTAKGQYSVAFGKGTYASSTAQIATGQYNIEDAENKYAHIVGNGESSSQRSNAHTLDWNGVGWFAGGLKIGGASQDDESAIEVATKNDLTGYVKTINGVTPNENGEVTSAHIKNVVLYDNTGYPDGKVLCYTEDARSLVDMFRDTTVRIPVLIRNMAKMGVGIYDQVFLKSYIIFKIDGGYGVRLHFSDKYADIIANDVDNTITLDPDWVAPAEIPDTTEAHQYLTTNSEGEKVWEDKLAYTVTTEQEIIPLQTATGNTAWYLNDSMTVNPTAGDVYIVEINGEKYESVIKAETALGGFYLGNAHLYKDSYEDTGESFLFMGLRVNISKTAYFNDDGTHTFRVYGLIEESTHIPAKYLPGGIKPGVGTNSLAVNGVLSEDVTAPNSFAANSGKAKQTDAFGVNFGEALGAYSFASGRQTVAKGTGSFTQGFSTVAAGNYQHVSGRSNIEDTEGIYAHIVGNGSNALTPSNAHTLDWDGNAWFQGTIKLGGSGQDDEAAVEVATKSDVAALQSSIDTLNGTDEGSVKHTVAESVATIVANAPEDFDTLKEVADWIANDTLGTADLLQRVSTAENNITTHINNKENPHNVTIEQIGLTALTDADIDAICSVEIYNVSEVSY